MNANKIKFLKKPFWKLKKKGTIAELRSEGSGGREGILIAGIWSDNYGKYRIHFKAFNEKYVYSNNLYNTIEDAMEDSYEYVLENLERVFNFDLREEKIKRILK